MFVAWDALTVISESLHIVYGRLHFTLSCHKESIMPLDDVGSYPSVMSEFVLHWQDGRLDGTS